MEHPGFAGRLANRLVDSPLVPLFVMACLVLGVYSLRITPREDRPDINVPTAIVILPWPGAGAERVDNQLARSAAAWIRQLPTVTEIRSSSTDHAALLTAEFEAGTAETDAYSELEELFNLNTDQLPLGVGRPRIETVGEERLVVFMATLSSATHPPVALEQMAGELSARLESVPGVRSIVRYGGERQAIEVVPQLEAMAAHGISLNQMAKALAVAGRHFPAGRLERAPVATVEVGVDIGSIDKLARMVVGRGAKGPVYLDEVAEIRAGTVHQNRAVLSQPSGASTACPAVTIAVTTLSGRNVADVTERIQARMAALKEELIPADVTLSVSYDAGREATERVYEVLNQLLTSILIVVGIIGLGLGWRAALIIALMMPTSLAIVPFVYSQFGFTLNPVSIAAMILAIGILSDDAVVMLENVSRTFREAGKKSRELTVAGVDEVGNPTILADILVVATLLPTAFIGGEMGQYVRALPVGASAAILFSLWVALMITPFFALRLLKIEKPREGRASSGKDAPAGEGSKRGYERVYRAMMEPLMSRSLWRWLFYLGLVFLLLASFSLVLFRRVQVGLTPLLDRRIFALQVEMPAGSTLTETLAATSFVSRKLRTFSEVKSLTIYAGGQAPLIYPPSKTPVPGEVPPHRAVLHVELVPIEQRERLSYEIGREVARQVNGWLEPFNASGYLIRIPSGPSSDRAVTAEIVGPDSESRQALADRVERLLRKQPGVVATQQFPEDPLPRLCLQVDPRRAALHGVAPAEVIESLSLAVAGRIVTEQPGAASREPIPVRLRLESFRRDEAADLKSIYIPGRSGQPVPLQELVEMKMQQGQPVLYRRGMRSLITVAADLDRSVAQPLTVQVDASRELQADGAGDPVDIAWLRPPGRDSHPALYWSGEWETTRDVYRDLGTAGAVVMVLIYLLLAGWFRSYTLPFLIMLPIPLIFIGVIPAHWLWGINLAGTGVLGIIALAGIVVRNSILLVDLIQRLKKEMPELKEAVLTAGIQRTRPILLTAATVMFGSGVLVFEPSLKPLGLTLASGVLVSTLLTLVLIPVIYYQVVNRKEREE
jgi:multidrug efflux pump subunit AcrB